MGGILEKRAKKFVVGIATKTSNARFQEEALPLWERFHRENIIEKIGGRLDQNLLVVYTDYEGDYTQPFTYLIGCEVASLRDIPEGMVGIEIPAATYEVFTTSGKFPDSLIRTWQTIWGADLKRSYTTDFEVYGPDFGKTENPAIDVCIAITKETQS